MCSGVSPFVQQADALKIQVHRIGMQRTFRSPRLSLDELGIQRIGEPRYDFVLHIEQIGDRFVEALGPKVIAGFGVDQLDVDPKPVAATLHRTFEHVADVQLAPDLLHVDRFAFERERSVVEPMTNEPLMRDRSVVRLSVTPSTK